MTIVHPPHHKLNGWITEENVVPLSLTSGKKKNVYEVILNHCAEQKKIDREDVDEILSLLLKREKLGTTALGNGIAVPHADVEGLKEPVVILGILKKPLDFDSLDGEPVFFIFFILTPKDDPTFRVNLLAQFFKLARDRYLVDQLRRAQGKKDVVSVLAAEL